MDRTQEYGYPSQAAREMGWRIVCFQSRHGDGTLAEGLPRKIINHAQGNFNQFKGGSVFLLRDPDDPRRRLLVKLLAAGAFSSLPMSRVLADVLGEKPSQLPPERSISRFSGQVSVNGWPATLKTRIGPNDTIETGKASEVIFVNGLSAYIL